MEISIGGTKQCCFYLCLDNQLGLEQKGLNKATLSHREINNDTIKVSFEMTSFINLYLMMGKYLLLGLTYNNSLFSPVIYLQGPVGWQLIQSCCCLWLCYFQCPSIMHFSSIFSSVSHLTIIHLVQGNEIPGGVGEIK